jgi:DNA polymerase-3 subunit beta
MIRIITNAQSLASAMSAVYRVVPAKASINILTCFEIKAMPTYIEITACDMEHTATHTLRTEVRLTTPSEGTAADAAYQAAGQPYPEQRFCVNAAKFLSLMKSLGDNNVDIVVKDDFGVDILTSFGKYQMVALPATEFPKYKQSDVACNIMLATEFVLDGINKTLFAVSTDSLRPGLMGIHFCSKLEGDGVNEQLTFVATDTRILSTMTHKYAPRQLHLDFGVTFSEKTALVFKDMFAKSPVISVYINTTSIEFCTDDAHLHSQLIAGVYPDFRRVIRRGDLVAKVDRTAMLASLRRALLAADGATRHVVLKFTLDTLTISGKDLNLATSAEELLACEFDGNVEIGFNADYLIKALNSIATEKVRITMFDGSRPALFEADGEVERKESDGVSALCATTPMESLCLLMPVNIGGNS